MSKFENLYQKHGLYSWLISIFITIILSLVQDVVFQLNRFITALDQYHRDCYEIMKEVDIFPIEIDLKLPTFVETEDIDADDQYNEQNDQNDHNYENQQQTTETTDLFKIEN